MSMQRHLQSMLMRAGVASLWDWPAWVPWSTFSSQLDKEINVGVLPSATRSAMGASLSGLYKWGGGVLGPDGKIYGIPTDAADILVIDPDAGTATRSAMGAALSGADADKWRGGVLGPDGKIYGIPTNAAEILIIDPDAGAFTVRIALDPRLNKF